MHSVHNIECRFLKCTSVECIVWSVECTECTVYCVGGVMMGLPGEITPGYECVTARQGRTHP